MTDREEIEDIVKYHKKKILQRVQCMMTKEDFFPL